MLRILAYHQPEHLSEAVGLLREGRAVVAGGTDLLVNPRYMSGVEELVDISGLDLDHIREEEGSLNIGALATMCEVARSALVRSLADGMVARAAAVCGSPNIRNAATLAGNLASALPSADTPQPLLALDASVLLVSMGEGGLQRREVALEEFFSGPAQSVRQPNEMIEEVRIPLPPAATRGGFYKVGRVADDIAISNGAASLLVEQGLVTRARVVVGAVAPTPLRVHAAEDFLVGRAPTEEVLQEAARMAGAASRPISDQRASAAYRGRMAELCARRALLQAAGLWAQGGELDHV